MKRKADQKERTTAWYEDGDHEQRQKQSIM